MVSKEDDDLRRRVQRLEVLIAVLISTDDFEHPDADYLIRRLLDDFESSTSSEFTYLLSDALRYRRRDKSPSRGSVFRRINQVDDRVSQLAKRVEQLFSPKSSDSFQSQVNRVSREVQSLRSGLDRICREAYEKFLIDSMGLNSANVSQTRFAPVRIYISKDDPNTVRSVEHAVKAYVTFLGFETATDYPPESGSWFKKWIAKSKDALSSEELEDTIKKGKRALELTALDKQRAEVNRENALAAGEFIKSIENVPNAVAQFGSLLITKTKGPDGECSVMTRVLTESEMEFIESNQEIMKDARSLLERLASVKVNKDTTIKLEGPGKP